MKAREILYQWNIILRHSGKCVLNLQFVICNRKPGQKGRMNLSSATHIKPFGLHMTCVTLVNTWTFIISPTDWWTHPVKHLASRETFYGLCCVAWATIFVLVKKCPVIIIATWADEHLDNYWTETIQHWSQPSVGAMTLSISVYTHASRELTPLMSNTKYHYQQA